MLKKIDMALQYNVKQKKIFAVHREDEFIFHYSDYGAAQRCYYRLIRETKKEKERYYMCEITLNDRNTQRLFTTIETTR